MCLAIPMRVIAIENNIALAEVGNTVYRANIELLDEVKIGDFIIVHAGFAIEKLNEEEALETLSYWNEIAEMEAEFRKKRKI